MVGEERCAVLVFLGKRHPELEAGKPRAAQAVLRTGAFGVCDAAARAHPVHVAGIDGLHRAEAVAVVDGAVEQVGDGRKPDMRMRPHVHAFPDREFGGPHLVEEDERSDHAPSRDGQGAAHREPAEIARAWHDHLFDAAAGRGGEVGLGHDETRLVGIAHEASFFWSRCRQPANAVVVQAWSGSSGARPAGVPSAPSWIFSTRISARRNSASQCFFRASPRS